MKLETLLARLTDNTDVNDPFGASQFPIYQSATFDLKKQTGEKLYDYSRTDNPTRNALEDIFAKAENGAGCVCTNTGIAAVALLFETVLRSGDSILVESDLYGGTNRLLNILTEKYCINSFRADFTNPEQVESFMTGYQIKLVLCESPTNPSLKIIDLASIAELCRKHGCLFAVDNSLATFVAQRPLELGADFSVFSTTKYISGHGCAVSGAIVAADPEWARKMAYYSNAAGRAQSPFESFLVSLGLPTLVYRMKVHEQNALEVAKYLKQRSDVAKVTFPLLPDHPQYELATQQMSICPGLITVEMDTIEKSETLIKRLTLFGEKASFGNSDSRIEQPSKISHASFSEEELHALGITKATLRLSIGLENVNDLIQDLEQALNQE